MKKVKVLVPSTVVNILNQDRTISEKSMNRVLNSIVEYNLKENKTLGKYEKNEKIDSQIQFYLYDYLVDEYFNYLRKNDYSNESDFLRDVFYEYMDKSRDERINILKNI